MEAEIAMIKIKYQIHIKILYKIKFIISKVFRLHNCVNCSKMSYECVYCNNYNRFEKRIMED